MIPVGLDQALELLLFQGEARLSRTSQAGKLQPNVNASLHKMHAKPTSSRGPQPRRDLHLFQSPTSLVLCPFPCSIRKGGDASPVAMGQSACVPQLLNRVLVL
jgi:hypothetical protein